MRLWSIHPSYLDAKGLVALWREALLAQAVLRNQTKGYKNHPQLDRFKKTDDPVAYIGAYLKAVYDESCRRGYCFTESRIYCPGKAGKIPVTEGQVEFEWRHFLAKMEIRDPDRVPKLRKIPFPDAHPSFKVVKGEREAWER
jgi:hypothetical protein